MHKKELNKATILKVGITSSYKDELIRFLTLSLEQKQASKPIFITTPNSEQLAQATTNDPFRLTLNRSTIALPDGIGIVIASKLLHRAGKLQSYLKKRLTGREMMISLCQLAASRKKRVFLLGGRPGVAAAAADQLTSRFNGLKVASWPGVKDITKESSVELAQTLGRIESHRSDILFVAYGAPRQELWVAKNLTDLQKIGVKIIMVVGGAFDIIAGKLPTAPKGIQSSGLEWLWRLIFEPWRFKRQLRLVKFWWLIFKQLLHRNNLVSPRGPR